MENIKFNIDMLELQVPKGLCIIFNTMTIF